MTRAELRSVLEGAGVPTAGQAMVHLLFRATLDGLIVRGPMIGGEHAFALVAAWLANVPGSTVIALWPSSPAATWQLTAPPTSAIWPSGPRCGCETRAPDWRRSPPS